MHGHVCVMQTSSVSCSRVKFVHSILCHSLYCQLLCKFIILSRCKIRRINYLDWGRECCGLCFCLCLKKFPLPLGAYDRLHYFIVVISSNLIVFVLF